MGSLITSNALSLHGDLVRCPGLVLLLDESRLALNTARGGEFRCSSSPIDELEKLVNGWYILLLVGMLMPCEFGLLIELHLNNADKNASNVSLLIVLNERT